MSESDPRPIALDDIGFADVGRAEAVLVRLAQAGSPDLMVRLEPILFAALAECPDPDGALLGFERYCSARIDIVSLLSALTESPALLERLATVLAHSQALADILVRNPESLELLESYRLRPLSRDALREAARASTTSQRTHRGKLNALRRFRRREMLRIAACDILGRTPFERAVSQLSQLADVCLEEVLDIAREYLRPEYGVPVDEHGHPLAFAIVSLGKLGGGELNYSSDIDLTFVCSGHGHTDSAKLASSTVYFERLASEVLNSLSEATEEGFLFRADARLRPDGHSGSLVRDLVSLERYYASRGRPWERIALIRARCSAGDHALGAEFIRRVTPFVYGDPPTEDEVRSIRVNKERAERRTRAADAYYSDVKEGYGGIRDVEFSVQLTQLRIGPTRGDVRTGHCLRAIDALDAAGALGHGQAHILREAYVFLRRVEHAMQLLQELPMSRIPSDPAARTALAARMGYADAPSFIAALQDTTRAVRGVFERLFLADGGVEAPPSAVQELVLGRAPDEADLEGELLSAGFRDPSGAEAVLRRLARLGADSGGERESDASLRERLAAIVNEVIAECSGSGDPDAALLNLERLVDASGSPLAFYWFLFDYRAAVHRLCHLCGRSDFLSERLSRRPELLDALLEPGALETPIPMHLLRDELERRASFERSHEGVLRCIRQYRAREMLRIGLRDVALEVPVPTTMAELTDLAEACLHVSLCAPDPGVVARLREPPLAVLGMGKLGGRELHYNSDLDLMFVTESAEVVPVAQSAAMRLIHDLSGHAVDGPIYAVDARLRPGGKRSPLTPPLSALRHYYAKMAQAWERLAAVKARWLCGAQEVGEEAVAIVREFAYSAPLGPRELADIHRIRGMITRQRAKEEPGAFNVKLSPGGILDLEFAVQILQIQTGVDEPAVRVPGTLAAISALADVGCLGRAEAEEIADAYRFLRTVGNRMQVVSERASDHVPLSGDDLAILAAKLPVGERDRPLSGTDLARELGRKSQLARELYGRAFGVSSR